MTLTFAARIEGREILCEIGSDTALFAPVFCFSLMALPKVVSGGQLIRCLAGYAEVLLPDIPAEGIIRVVLAHDNADYSPRNRAWLPLGAYLRTATGCLALPPLPSGVRGEVNLQPTGPFAGLPLVPQPTEWHPSTGYVDLHNGLSGDLPPAVVALSERLNFGTFANTAGLPFRTKTVSDMAESAYEIHIEAGGVLVRSSGAAGLFHACVTLLTLMQTTQRRLPLGRILDAPRFGYRGQHLDCARHFFSVDTILRLLDLMALVKLNRLHWHFADDEAFRLEVTTAPDLWRKTAFRGEAELVPGVFGGGIRAGGSYSKTDVARILARAAELHIEVLPEIEIPAHSHGMVKTIPGLRDPGDNGEETSVQGYLDNIVNPAMPATWDLLLPLIDEVAAIFPMGMVHLGCDEAPHGAWSGSPAVAALKAREGLETSDDVQGWMMEKLSAHLARNGIRSAAWEEAAKGANGGVGNNTLLFSWTGQGPGLEAARRGHEVVMCPAQHVYFDLAHTSNADDWGATWAGTVALEDVVNWRPVPKGAEDVAHRIVGVQGCFWGEFTTEDAQMEAMLAPRILGMANKAWDKTDRVDGPGLRALAAAYAPLFDTMNWRRNKGA
jgi:hexosaminidase